ncbi:MAG: serine hydrolase, partial [Acidobacteriota bacterium]|nr:serine hydrolase [Acidobacteriota bacterium]
AMIETFESDPFDFDPGEGWHYSNSGYFLLGHIVEKVSSQTYADFLQKQLFEPLGMRDTGVHHWSTVLDHEATGYSVEGDEVKRALDWDMSRAGGAGALYSTVGDLFRWNEAVFGGTALAEESIAAALTPVTVEMEERPEDALLGMLGGGYGYGWIISESRGRRTVEHGGGLQGWVAHLVRYPELNTTVVVLANAVPPPAGLNPSLQSRAIAEIYLWPELVARESVAVARGIDPSVYDAYAGRYEFMGLICTIAREGDRLFSTLTGQPKLELHPRSETEFFLKEADVTFTFEREDGGQTDEVVIVDRGRRFVARRIPERVVAKIDPVLLEAYAGEYDYRMGRVLTVTAEDGKLFAQMTGQPRFEIFPESEAEFFWKIVNAKITFVKNEQGIVVKAIHEQGGAKLEASKIK